MSKQELANWIEKYGRDIYSFCMYLTHNQTEADELYQDTWVKVVNALPDLNAEGNVKSFCLAVAVGLWKNKKRKYAWRNRIAPMVGLESGKGDDYIADYNISPEDETLARQTKQAVWQAVDRLPPKLRLIVALYYMEKLSLPQISKVVNIPEGTAKSRLYQARKKLAEELGDLYE